MSTTNGQGQRANAGPLEIAPTQAAKFSAKSPHSKAQRQRILQALRQRPQTTEDLRRIGIFQAPARIKELRDRFHFDIETTRLTVIDREGFPHPRAALYVLHEEKGAV
jgi:hypothetical protein